MGAALASFMRRAPIWPSTFPKLLSVIGILASLIFLSGVEKTATALGDIDCRRLHEYKIGQAGILLGLMVFYALALRPVGFLAATGIFLFAGIAVLGERRWVVMVVVSAVATGVVWYLVQEVLGICLRPLPMWI